MAIDPLAMHLAANNRTGSSTGSVFRSGGHGDRSAAFGYTTVALSAPLPDGPIGMVVIRPYVASGPPLDLLPACRVVFYQIPARQLRALRRQRRRHQPLHARNLTLLGQQPPQVVFPPTGALERCGAGAVPAAHPCAIFQQGREIPHRTRATRLPSMSWLNTTAYTRWRVPSRCAGRWVFPACGSCTPSRDCAHRGTTLQAERAALHGRSRVKPAPGPDRWNSRPYIPVAKAGRPLERHRLTALPAAPARFAPHPTPR